MAVPDKPTPTAPSNLSEYAAACLSALAESGLGRFISIGGAVGLAYYYEYRATNDLDAWWDTAANDEQRQRVLQLIEDTLKPFGEVKRRTWGDVVSLELSQQAKTIFSVQIAQRSAQLNPPLFIQDGRIGLDSLDDLAASKMVALIERGAPRDFRDIYAVCNAELITPKRCWQLWRQRQQLMGSDANPDRAKLAIETHLARIALHRPLEKISSPEQRLEAEKTRTWFTEVFLKALEHR